MADIEAYFNFQTREPAKAVFKIAPVVTNYPALTSKPQINSVELIGNKSLSDLGITAEIEAKVNARVPAPPSTGTYVLKAVDGIVQWIAE